MNTTQPGTNNAAQLVKSFVPAILQKQYIHFPDRKMGDPLLEDHVTLLWIDICNFSPLCIRLMKDTVAGVENITSILRNHYDFVLNLVRQYGGEPLFFAGDGLMSAWPGDNTKAGEAVAFAATCACRIIAERQTVNDKKELISLHAIVAVGPWQMVELEGPQGNRLVSFFGDVFSALSASSKNKAPDHLLITDAALSFLSPQLKSDPVEYNTSILRDSPGSPPPPAVNNGSLSDEALKTLKLFVPRTLSFPLNAEHLQWLAEIRPVTILFVRLPNSGKTSTENLNQLRESVALARPLVQKYDGLLNQVWMDEKESNMLICFGPPPSAHIDNPERSVRLGFEIHHLLKRSGFENSVGLSSGMAYCGILGNDHLRQYTVIGDVVNLSAHIAGIKKNEIFCDKATYSVSNKSVSFGSQMLAVVKGHYQPISLYVPKSLFDEDTTKSKNHLSVGRERELALLVAAFQRTATGKSECIIIEGENGMGKTQLVEQFVAGISAEDAVKAAGLGDDVLSNTPYASLRPIISTLLGIGHTETEKISSTVYESLIKRFGNRACLLNIVLNTSIPDSDEIRTLTSSQRVEATQELLLTFLNEESRRKPLILIFDDARWVDEFTLRLIKSVRDNLSHCLIVLAFQITEGLTEVQRLKDQGAETIVLKELDRKNIESLICLKLGVSSVSPDISDLVLRKSKGNPFFCIELADSLLNNELLLFENNSCSLVKDADINKFSLPETVSGAIRRRIDRMGQGSQISLKVGSVVGNRFVEKIVCSVYPIISERDLVPLYLREVEQNGFLNATIVDNLNGYLFNSATTVEVAYEMTLAEQRRQLHRDIAEWYEDNFKDTIHSIYVRLANHWIQANEKDLAVAYYEKEATRLFRLGFVKEALDVGLEGIKLLDQHIPRELASIRQKIGENMSAIASLMEGRTIESLIRHKKSDNLKTEKVVRLLLFFGPFAHQSQQGELFALMTIICQRLTLEDGNGESAAEVYAMYAVIYQTLTGDIKTAFTWSALSLAVDKQNGSTLQSRVLFIHCWFIAPWRQPIKELVQLSQLGADAGFKSGDIIYACFNLSLEVILKSTSGAHLNLLIRTATNHIARNNNAVVNAAFHLLHERQVAKALQGATMHYTSLSSEECNEERDLASICKTDLFNQIAYYLVSKLKLHVHFGNWEEAVVWGKQSIPLLPAFANQPGHIELEQFYTMAALYKAAEMQGDTAANFSNIAISGIQKIRAWAELCKTNFMHKALLVEAIREGFWGDATKAEKQFVDAAEAAMAAGYIQDRGLAFEHLVRLKKRKGNLYSGELQLALEAYRQWGAEGKVRYLLEEFSN